MADGGPPARMFPHRVISCTACRHCNAPCAPGMAFLSRLGAAIALAPVGAEFELVGSASLRCNARLCPVIWRATADGAWLWGDVAPEVPLAALTGSGTGAGATAAAEIVTGVAVLH